MRMRDPPQIGVFLESTPIRKHFNTNRDNNGDAKCQDELGFKREMTHSISAEAHDHLGSAQDAFALPVRSKTPNLVCVKRPWPSTLVQMACVEW